jgi:DNA repair protein RadC
VFPGGPTSSALQLSQALPDPERLAEVAGVGDNAITALKVVRPAAVRLVRSQVIDRPVLSSWQALLGYSQASMAYKGAECFRGCS